MTVKAIWVSPEILCNDTDGYSANAESEDWDVPYYEINHAFDILNNHESASYRKDAIVNMHRAVNFRIKQLNEMYAFATMPGISEKKPIKAMLEIGLIKPLMLKKITDIRNNVQHNHKSIVPSLVECFEYAEFAWYFLKSTDRIAKRQISSVDFICPSREEEVSMSVYYYPKAGWQAFVSLEILKEMCSKDRINGWLQLAPYQKEVHGKNIKEFYRDLHAKSEFIQEKEDGMIWIDGVVTHSCSANKAIIMQYFSV